jgi:hypothetical protein
MWGAEVFPAGTFAAALWPYGLRMIVRAEELRVAWPTLQAIDVGNLVSFFNASARLK